MKFMVCASFSFCPPLGAYVAAQTAGWRRAREKRKKRDERRRNQDTDAAHQRGLFRLAVFPLTSLLSTLPRKRWTTKRRARFKHWKNKENCRKQARAQTLAPACYWRRGRRTRYFHLFHLFRLEAASDIRGDLVDISCCLRGWLLRLASSPRTKAPPPTRTCQTT